MTSFLAVLPSIHPPSTEACVATMGAGLLGGLMLVDNAVGPNLGVAASWNLGARRVLAERLDWLVVVSAATRFGPDGGRRFLDALDANEGAWVVESNDWCNVAPAGATVGWHLLAWSRGVLERVGLFDENYWPAYGEDGDISWRIGIAREEDGFGDAWRSVESGASITMLHHGVKLSGVEVPSSRNWAYYRAKAGGMPGGHETYRRPFGDPSLPLSWWPVPPDPRSIMGGRR